MQVFLPIKFINHFLRASGSVTRCNPLRKYLAMCIKRLIVIFWYLLNLDLGIYPKEIL